MYDIINMSRLQGSFYSGTKRCLSAKALASTTGTQEDSALYYVEAEMSEEIFFWEHINKKGQKDCWNWLGKVKTRPRYRFKGIYMHVSRIAYIFAHQVELKRSDFVCHTCDNDRCCNPDHLYLGTPKSNGEDRKNRGRNNDQRGERGSNHKLTKYQVIEIREKYATKKYMQKDLAYEYRVSRGCIEYIVTNLGWKEYL